MLGHRLQAQSHGHLFQSRQQFLLLFNQGQRLLVVAKTQAQLCDHTQQFGMGKWLRRKFALTAALTGGQQLACIQHIALLGGACVVEQADHEILHCLRTRCFAHGLAALPHAGSQCA